MPAYDFNVVQTKPGSGVSHPFAPPADFSGTADDYRSLMRLRYRDRNYAQIMLCWVIYSRTARVTFAGPFGVVAREIFDMLKAHVASKLLV